jgi:hypothetical protein
VTKKAITQFLMRPEDKRRLKGLPWHTRLEEWGELGVQLLIVRRGESRHPVVFVEQQGVRYAIKETTPRMAEREIRILHEIENRGVPALSPIGYVIVPSSPIALDMPKLGGATQYISGDRGYTVTRLAPRVIPHVLLYRLPLNKRTKQHLLSAVAVLMVELHEHGVYWGDPSLANVLIRIDGRRILAIMADAETSELFPGPVSDGLREQDLALFGESLAWQAEDLRQARDLPEDVQLLDDKDFRYFEKRYRWLRRQHTHLADSSSFRTLFQAEQFLHRLNHVGYSLLGLSGQALQSFTTVLPGWYQRRIYELIHVSVPRLYARRFYNLILGHQYLMHEKLGRDVSVEEAAQDWYTNYHLPAILLLRQHLASNQDPMQAYFDIMDHKWNMSVKAGHEIPLDEAILDWSMQRADTGEMGAIDPASVATWWREREPVAQALEPPLIESKELEPLLSTSERPLVRLNQPELAQKLPEILKDNRKQVEDRKQLEEEE